jgi:TolB-like protein/DNA-binding winged helix-turn-helix (wHTH) protein/Flp pilus assembly protein TadD
MSLEVHPASIVRFGVFEVDLRAGELRKQGVRIKLQEQPFQVLKVLLGKSGEVVTRDELRSQLWSADTFVDFDNGLNTCINKLREALGDSTERPRFIETIPRRGYRFIASVTIVEGEGKATPPAPSRWQPVVLVAAMVAALVAGGLYWRSRSLPRLTDQGSIVLAVLPLDNLSGDASQDYFADGMTDALITDLARIKALKVISRTSVLRYKGVKKPLPEIARELGANVIVEGSVVRSGDRVRITAQLINAANDTHIWAEHFDRDMRDALALQGAVADAIARQIRVAVTPAEQKHLESVAPVDPEAYESYLKGRYYSNQRTENAMKQSIAYFQEAIAKDPAYALAYSGLADTYTLLGFRGHVPSKDSLLQAKTAALKAVELDDTLAEPHASLAFIAETLEWDWPTAQREYTRALELNPGYARARHWYAGFLTYMGRLDEGIAEEKRARELDPLSLPVNNALAGRFLAAGRIPEALEQLHKTLDMDPHFAPAHQTLGWVYLKTGKNQEAIREFQQAVHLSGADDLDLTLDLGYAYAVVGRREEATAILNKLREGHERGLVPSGSIAILYGALGNFDQAFAFLEKAYQERDPELTYLKIGRRFDPLRRDPRYRELLQRMRLAD